MQRPPASLCSLVLIALLLPASAAALQGDAPTRYAPNTREVRLVHPATQARLDASPAWQRFLDEHGFRWRVTWDEQSLTPHSILGEGWWIDEAALADDGGAFGVAWQILSAHLDLLGPGVGAQDLDEGLVDRRGGITTVTFIQHHKGVAVEEARISLRFKAGRFVMASLRSMPGIRIATVPGLGSAAAVDLAIAQLGWPATEARLLGEPELVVLPRPGSLFGQIDYRLAWRVELREDLGRPSHRLVWIDAQDGTLLRWDELVRFITGTVLAEIDDRYPQAGLTTAAMPLVSVSGDGADTADGNGVIEVAAAAPAAFSWQAGSVRVDFHNEAGSEPTFSDSLDTDGGSLLAVPAAGNPTNRRERSILDLHVNLHIVIDRALVMLPSLGWPNEEVEVFVNVNDTCNAWYDGSLNFLRQGNGCNNSGRVADIAWHEYGHGFHDWAIIPNVGGWEAALGEGLSDYLASTISDDHHMAPGFFTGTEAPLRDVEPNRSWPGDVDVDPHITGLIIAGALWDLRKALIEDLGYDAGVLQSDHIFAQIASRAPDIPSSYDEALLADDDNGNLADGTPNICAIVEAFGFHGLGPGAGVPAFFVQHDPLIEVQPEHPIPLEVSAALSNPDCADGDVTTVRAVWTTDPTADVASFQITTLESAGGDLYVGELPEAPNGSYLRYRIELLGEGGALLRELPGGSITDPWFGAWVGPRENMFSSDFESDDGGFTHELISGADQEGADDWGWGSPGGLAGDPTGAFSGTRIWGNDIVPEENWNGAYQPNVHNVLRSPVIHVGNADPVFLQFRRWLTVEDGFYDQAQVRVNGALIWSQFASDQQNGADQHHIDVHWAFRSYDITGLADDDGRVQVEFELISDGGVELGGWNLDDFAIVGVSDWVDPGDDDDDDDDVIDDDDTDPQQDDDDGLDDDDDDDQGPAGTVSGGLTAQGGCACTTPGRRASPPPPLLLLGLLGLGAVRRRR
jgi:MYXO-CTERM domain-containing protein